MRRLTEKTVAEGLKKYRGNMASVAKTLGTTRQGVWEYVQKHPALLKVQREIKESFLDNVETSLESEAIKGNVTAQIFLLKTQGRNRGYVTRQEVVDVTKLSDEELERIARG